MRALKIAAIMIATTAIGGLTIAPAANAAFGVAAQTSLSNTQAGAHADFTLKLNFSGDERVSDMNLDLPAGLIGDPNATARPLCTKAQMTAGSCPAYTKVGTVDANATAYPTLGGIIPLGEITTDAHGAVYLMEPQGNEAARLAIKIVPELLGIPLNDNPMTMDSPIYLRGPGVGNGDYGLRTVVSVNPTASLPVLGDTQVRVNNMTLTLMAKPQNGAVKPFMTNPTSCGPKVLNVSATSQSGNDVDVSAPPMTITGCDATHPPFNPTLELAPSQVQAGQPTPISVTVKIPAPSNDVNDLVQSTVKKTVAVLPQGMAISAAIGSNGLGGCTDAQFGVNADRAPTCPDDSAIGTVNFVSPLIGSVPGTVYLGTATADAPMRVFAYAQKGQARIKLIGTTTLDQKTGQVTTTFGNTPDQPFTEFTLSFRGGPNAVIKAPDACTPVSATAAVTPTSGGPVANITSNAIDVVGCKPAQFAPTMTATATPTTAAADTTVETVISRSDDDELLKGVSISMPPGLLGRLSAIPVCPLASAQTGNCSEDSRVGSVIAKAGTGTAPLPILGPVYLAEGTPGAIASLAIVVPAKVGPVDLGQVVVMGKLIARPDVGIDLTVDNIPSIVGGVPMYIKSMDLVLNKPGFMFNASSCAPQAVSGTLTSVSGKTAAVNIPYQATGCDGLAFNPQMTAKLTGTAASPGFTASVYGSDGESTMKAMELTLPSGIGASAAALGNMCPLDTYNAGNCPASSVIGSATAQASIIADPLTGPVTLVRIPGQALPALGMKLSGAISLDIMIKNGIAAGNRIVSTIDGVPDAPIRRFDLTLNPGGMLAADPSVICKDALTANGVLTGWNSAVVNRTVPVDTSAVCGKAPVEKVGTPARSASLKGIKSGKPTLQVKLYGRNVKLTSLRVGVPAKQLRIVSKTAKRVGRGLVAGVSKRLSVSKTALTVKAPAKGSNSLAIVLRKGTLRNGKIKVGQKVTLSIRYTQAGVAKAKTIRVRVTAGK